MENDPDIKQSRYSKFSSEFKIKYPCVSDSHNNYFEKIWLAYSEIQAMIQVESKNSTLPEVDFRSKINM